MSLHRRYFIQTLLQYVVWLLSLTQQLVIFMLSGFQRRMALSDGDGVTRVILDWTNLRRKK